MKNEFLPYEQSLALKELGFDEPCFAIYNLGLSEFETANVGQIRLFSSLFKIDDKQSNISYVNDKNSSKVTAPLWQQTFDWFRKKHNLFHEITLDSYKEPYRLYARILKLENHRNFVINRFEINHFDNNKYEEAELECLKKLIEIVKNK